MKEERPDIYPPSIYDPLLDGKPSKPDPEGVAKDRYLGELARESEEKPEEDPQR